MKILTLNPGSTSTKIGFFDNMHKALDLKIAHTSYELKSLGGITDQLGFRLQIVKKTLKEHGASITDFDAVSARGGLLKPMEGGTYLVNEAMVEDLKKGVMGDHASNLGGLMAYELIKGTEIPAFIVDPVVVDEMEPVARITGVPEIKRNSIFHALNQKAAARTAAREMGRTYEDLNLIVVHMGGGISVGAHLKGKVVDVNDALYGDGPMAPERAGSVPPYAFAQLVRDKGLRDRKLRQKLVGGGGIAAHLGTSDMMAVEQMVENNDEKAVLVYNAMVYQIAKEVGALAAAVFKGDVDVIVITGGLAHSERIVNDIETYVTFICRTLVIAGEEELEALAAGALRVLRGEEEYKTYE
jgi:butyrate kinase